MTAFLWLILLVAGQDPPGNAQSDDIVVTAREGGCRVRLAEQDLSDREFDRHAKEWAQGRVVRVYARANADLKCLTKIAFKLADRGVKRMEFIDPSGRPAQPFMSETTIAANTGIESGHPNVQERERLFIARRAAKLILEGKCGEARRIVLENGDLESAAQVAEICRP